MAESLKFSLDLPVSTERVYRAWLDAYEYSQFTGQPAHMDARPGGAYSALNGGVTGQMQTLTPFNRIVQTWRSSLFPPGSPDSQVEIKLEPTCLGAQLTMSQTGLPDGSSVEVLKLWETRIFRPLLEYFEALMDDRAVDMDG